jgi:Leucine-rich repeat (LRR) protein
VGNLHNIEQINLSQCNLTTLPGEIGFCHRLEEIILMANQIESLPETLKDCRSLKYLKMSYRSFNSLLDTYMENLISKGQIKSEHIPMVVFELEMLHELDLKHTKINIFPENTLKSLRHLYLDSNYFENFTLQQTAIALAASSSTINAASTPTNMLQPPPNTLITPPSVFTAMSSTLNVLTISNNLLKEIPSELFCLVNLEILDLSFNLIKRIPQYLSALTKLKELYLHNNSLIVLNASIGLLKGLKKLSLNNNELVDSLEEITFKKTTELYIGIPENVYDLVELEYFDLSYNKLTQISPKICNLFNLKKAHTYDKLNDKHGLWLIGNPLKIPPKEIWQTQNIRKIYNYLSSYVQRNLNYVYYSKLIFMGKSCVGKSQVVDSFFMDTCLPASQQQHEDISSFQSSSMIIANERGINSKTPVKDKENNHVEFIDREDRMMPMNRSFVINDEFEDSSLAYILSPANKPNSGCVTTRSVANLASASRNVTSRISGKKYFFYKSLLVFIGL